VTQTDAPALRRVQRALASIGVFTEARLETFAITPLAALLRTEYQPAWLPGRSVPTKTGRGSLETRTRGVTQPLGK
jgi:hypothetical protein